MGSRSYRKSLTIAGGLVGVGGAILLPAIFWLSSTGLALHRTRELAIVIAVAWVYIPFCLLGGFLIGGYADAEKSRDPEFDLRARIQGLIQGLFRQREYRWLLILSVLTIAIGCLWMRFRSVG